MGLEPRDTCGCGSNGRTAKQWPEFIKIDSLIYSEF